MLAACVSSAVFALLAPVAAQADPEVSIATSPGLTPAFAPEVSDYVTSCVAGSGVSVAVTDTDGTPVSVDGQAPHTSSFTTSVPLASGQRFTVAIGPSGTASSYNVRCLPSDFPPYTSTLYPQNGTPQAAYYIVTPGNGYVAMFNHQGVPVWWYKQPGGNTPIDANLLSDDNLSWDVETQAPYAFGLPGGVSLQEYSLFGTQLTTLHTVLTPTDLHEGLQLPNGNFLMTTFILNRYANLSSIGEPAVSPVLDAGFQEVTPTDQVVFAWDSNGRIAPAESLAWKNQVFPYPEVAQEVWDEFHINSVAVDGSNFLISMRHTNAIWLINGKTGSIIWKLGGTRTSKSLTILGDPDAATDFGGQHDARLLPNGDISLFDDGTGRNRAPRVLEFRIDPILHAATLVQSFDDSTGAVTAATCCGSARELPGGHWVVAWGGTQYVDEVATTSSTKSVPVLRIAFASPYFTYRAIPILPGRLTDGELEAAMDEMNGTPTL